MAESPLALLQQLYNSQQQQIQALQQPAPQQGGILSGADPVMLSLAAGLLSPTKTGGFGESLGAGLSAASGPLSEIRRQEAARADKLSTLMNAQAKLAMDMYEIQTGGRRGRGEDPSMTAKRIIDIAQGYKSEYESDPESPSGQEAFKRFQFLRKQAEDILGYPVDFGDTGGGDTATDAPEEEASSGDGSWLSNIGLGGAKKPEPKTPAPKEKTSAPKPKTVEEPPEEEPEATGKTAAKPYTGEKPPAKYPNAKKGKYGYWYVPVDPNDPSKGYQYVAE